jgi:bis(5'-adenosyl)-triphosphatase
MKLEVVYNLANNKMKSSSISHSQNNMAPTTYRFGDSLIQPEQVFISRKHIYAMVYVKAIVPGHVLVCPTRQVQHFRDLTELETLELFVCAKEIVNKFKDLFKVKSFNFLI